MHRSLFFFLENLMWNQQVLTSTIAQTACETLEREAAWSCCTDLVVQLIKHHLNCRVDGSLWFSLITRGAQNSYRPLLPQMSNAPVYKYDHRERSKTSQYLWQQKLFKDFSAARFNPGLMFSINMLPGIRESLIEPEPQSKTSGLSYTPLPETLSWVSTQPSKKKEEEAKQERTRCRSL